MNSLVSSDDKITNNGDVLVNIGEAWTKEIEDVLERVRVNSVYLSEYHRKRYYHFKGYGKYFRIPLIVLASINSTASVGLQPILQQEVISGITCVIGMIMGILGAMELYLGIQSSMDLELKQSKEFYTLAIEIYKTLSLRRDSRGEDGKDYLNMKYSTYVKLCEASNILRHELPRDMLVSNPQGNTYYTIDTSLASTTIPAENDNYLHHHIPCKTEDSVRLVTADRDTQLDTIELPNQNATTGTTLTVMHSDNKKQENVVSTESTTSTKEALLQNKADDSV